MRQRTLQVAQQTGLPFFFIGSHQQHGNSFGERFQEAFNAVFSKGYTHVIAIGTDCPTLNCGDILQAVKKLNQERVVIGPDERGGVYLLGLSKSHFNNLNFNSLNWNTSSLTKSIFQQLNECELSLNQLRKLADINHVRELSKYVKHNINWLSTLLLAHSKSSKIFSPNHLQVNYNSFEASKSLVLRGPPNIASSQ